MTSLRTNILLASLGIFAAAEQLITTRWGLASNLTGGLLCGLIILIGMKLLALKSEQTWLPPLVAAAASLLGLGFGIAGAGASYSSPAWTAPLFAALPFGMIALKDKLQGARCQLCHARLRGLLSFSCPRCHLSACENCWQFERGRCRLCDVNQAPLLPLDYAWWQERFGSQVRGARCTLCLRAADWEVSHWACASCGNSQCRSCWDDNNGQCSRCGWIIPDIQPEVSDYVAAGTRREKSVH